MAIDLKQLEQSGVYEAKAPVSSLLQDLVAIGQALDAAALARKKLSRIGWMGILGAVSLFILAAVMSNAIVGLLAVVSLVVGIVFFVKSSRAGSKLMTGRKRHDLLEQMLKVFENDSGDTTPFAVRLGLKSAPELLREEPMLHKKNGKQQFYKENIASVDAELLDGTSISENVVELVRKRSYTNPRGKSKSKTRTGFRVTVKLDYPSETYGDAQPARQALKEEIKVPASARLRDFRFSEKAILVKTTVGEENEIAQTAAMACLGAYRILNLARRVASAPPQGGQA